MISWLRGIVLAVVFGLVGAFATSLWLEVRHDTRIAAQEASGRWKGHRIRVEVLNGAGVNRLARRATERLRELDFDVVYYGDAERFGRDTSVVIARVDAIEPARRVADALGLGTVLQRPDRNLYLDVTVILGTDWADGRAAEGSSDEGGLERWWSRVKRALARLWPG